MELDFLRKIYMGIMGGIKIHGITPDSFEMEHLRIIRIFRVFCYRQKAMRFILLGREATIVNFLGKNLHKQVCNTNILLEKWFLRIPKHSESGSGGAPHTFWWRHILLDGNSIGKYYIFYFLAVKTVDLEWHRRWRTS